MDVLIIMVFISLALLAGGLVLLLSGVKNGDFDQGDRLALLPLESDDAGNQTGSSDPPDRPRSGGDAEEAGKCV